MNKIVLYFNKCTPAPAEGYKIFYRVAGTDDPYTSAGTFYNSPAIFYDHINPAGTCYEGYIYSDCGNDVTGNNILFQTCESGIPIQEYEISLVNPCNGINSEYLISNGTPGDIVTVRASFGGVIKRIGGLFTRADLSISSPDGTSDAVSSTCYADGGSHGFTITADTVITMAGTTAHISLMAVVNNSNESTTNVGVTIIDVNGNAKSISIIGCKGNSATAGTC